MKYSTKKVLWVLFQVLWNMFDHLTKSSKNFTCLIRILINLQRRKKMVFFWSSKDWTHLWSLNVYPLTRWLLAHWLTATPNFRLLQHLYVIQHTFVKLHNTIWKECLQTLYMKRDCFHHMTRKPKQWGNSVFWTAILISMFPKNSSMRFFPPPQNKKLTPMFLTAPPICK